MAELLGLGQADIDDVDDDRCLEHRLGIDVAMVAAARHLDLEVQMRIGAANAGPSQRAEHMAGVDLLAFGQTGGDPIEVHVRGRAAVGVLDLDVATAALVARAFDPGDLTRQDRDDGRAARAGEIDPAVTAPAVARPLARSAGAAAAAANTWATSGPAATSASFES